MEFRTLGASGLKVSAIGLGCNNFGGRIGPAESRAVIHRAIEAGITLFDTADLYGNRGGSETIIGETLGARRKDIVLATKFGMQMDDAGTLKGASRGYIATAVEASLKRLKTDWIDLYQVHTPDPSTPIEETLGALNDLVRAGKVRAIGTSNFSRSEIEGADSAAGGGMTSFTSVQDEYSLLARGVEAKVLPAVRKLKLGFLPYFPLAGGLLSGKYRQGEAPPAGTRLAAPQRSPRFLNDANLAKVEALRAFAGGRGRSLLDLAFAWLLAEPAVSSVIAGATKPEQIDANIAASAWTLSPAERAEASRIAEAA
ncbi:MAG: aldo/keto reductase [Bauldia sp.]